MNTQQARSLLYRLSELMPSSQQKATLQALLLAFLRPQRSSLPEHNPVKSASSISRFLNRYDWPTRKVVRLLRASVTQWLLATPQRGRPHLRVIVDLTGLEKSGRFARLSEWIQVFNGKRGLQLVVLYLELGKLRLPWGFAIWRGRGTSSPSQLALRLLDSLPAVLSRRYRVLVLADGGFGNLPFLKGLRQRGLHALVNVRKDRLTQEGTPLYQYRRRGARIFLLGLDVPLWLSWFYLERNGKPERHYVVCTRKLSGGYLVRLGKMRWHIEAFFKTLKRSFAFARVAQGSKLGVLRYLILSLLAYLLAFAAHLVAGTGQPTWVKAAQSALETLLPAVLASALMAELERRRSFLQRCGIRLDLRRFTWEGM